MPFYYSNIDHNVTTYIFHINLPYKGIKYGINYFDYSWKKVVLNTVGHPNVVIVLSERWKVGQVQNRFV